MALAPYKVTVITKEDNPYNVIPNAPIEIRERLANGTSGGLSLIYSDSEGTAPITQTGATADANGEFVFYAEAAEYNAIYQAKVVPVDVGLTPSTLPAVLINDLSQAYEFPTVAAYKAFTTEFPVGKVIYISEREAEFNIISGTGTGNDRNVLASDQVSQSANLKTGRNAIALQWGAKADGDPLGATANGTDNGVIIQSIIDYLEVTYQTGLFSTAGSIQLDAGTYETTTGLSVPANIGIYGRGVDVTELQNQAGNTSTYNMINMPDRGNSQGFEKENRNLSLGGFSVNGNDNNTTGNVKTLSVTNALYCWFTNMEFKQAEGKNVELTNCSNFFWSNVMFRDGNQSQLVLNDCTNITFGSSVTIRTGFGWGVEFPATSQKRSDRISFAGTRFASSAEGAIGCFDKSRNISVQGCTFAEGSGSSSTYGTTIYVDDNQADSWSITGNKFTRIFRHCIDLASDNSLIDGNFFDSNRRNCIISRGIDCQISNNQIVDAGYQDDNMYDGIQIHGSRTEVFGNSILFANDVGEAGQKLRYGISFETTAGNGRCYNNRVGLTSSHKALNLAPTSVMSYKNSGAPAQLSFVVAKMLSDQTGIGSSTTVVEFNGVYVDKQTDFDTASFKFISPSDGWYRVNANLYVQNVVGASQVIAKVENITVAKSLLNIQNSNYNGTLPINGLLYLDEGDEAQVKVRFTGGSGEVNDESYLQIERADM